MRRHSRIHAWVTLALLGLAAPVHAAGRDAGAAVARSLARTAASANALPPGHPPTDGEEAEGLPPGHPVVNEQQDDDEEESTDEALPPGHPSTQAPTQAPALAQGRLPQDTSDVDNSLPAGVIIVEARDAQDKPVPGVSVTLGILQQSVAKGESRRRVVRQVDENGVTRFDGLEPGGDVAYRVTIPFGSDNEPATYAALPFRLDLHAGQRVRVHIYPVTHDVAETLIGMEGILYIELKDDALQFDEFFRIYNLSAVTWVPHGVVITLPKGFKAFNTDREMSDTGFDEAPKEGAKLRGTFTPGQHDAHFRYQIPFEGDDSVDFTLTLPPHVAQMRVIAEASKTMTLRADGFGNSVSDRNQRGQRVLVVERKVRSGEPALARIHVSLDNIPIEGTTKWVAIGIAAATVGLGLYLAMRQASSAPKQVDAQDSERARSRLVAEIAALERARRAGDVGPSAYARIHAALIDALARLLPMETSAERSARG
jgi:hypothetical protein